jgi:hypothetical protein
MTGPTPTSARTTALKARRRMPGSSLAERPNQELPADSVHLARGADAARRGRISPHARRQQQRLLPGQRNELARLELSGTAQEIFRFTRGMIAFRRAHPILSKEQFYTDAEIHWFGPHGGLPNWSDPNSKQFACLIHEDQRNSLYLMFNAWAEAADFGLPPVLPGTRWYLAVDTSRETPQDLFAAGKEPLWEDPQITT